ncbi:MAG: imidazolonepropionase [Alphaproteobacteria bacterium HGW-Alphaproteobacteria-18]|nr:MAG: imidazolonepropionase [Alphaproteobacteria bacterium HGW-Alphaproteobacteria-18]
MTQKLFTHCSLATMRSGGAPYGFIEDGAFMTRAGQITWVGQSARLPAGAEGLEAVDLGGRLVTPALIDCHTHLVHAGDRSAEFEMRLLGASYEDIARSGGGIHATVLATRAASDEDLLAQSLVRVDDLIAEGVAVIEIKSGYGLTIGNEIRMLRIAREIQNLRPVKVITTWLAAHAVPKDFDGDQDAFIDSVVIPGLRLAAAQGLVDMVDGFCETIAFSPAQISRVFDEARRLGVPVKLHAEQLSDQKGALLAASYGALSVDHLEHLAPEEASGLASAGTVAVLLPGAYYMLRETRLPPVGALRAAGVELAVSTDCNPGTSPISSLLTAMNMACTLFRLTPEEALVGTTRAAARALGLAGEFGTIDRGARAELAVWNLTHPAQLACRIGGSPLNRRITDMRGR